MFAATLWIEMAMAGFVYLVALGFLFWPPMPAGNFRALLPYRDLLPYISVVIAGTSYVVGIVAHRLVTALLRPYRDRVGFIKRLSSWRSAEMATVWQYGSQRLHREVDFHFGLLALLRSFLFSVPLLALTSVQWLVRSHLTWAWKEIPVCAVVLAICWVAHNRQLKLYRDCEREAVKLTKGDAAKNSSSCPKNVAD